MKHIFILIIAALLCSCETPSDATITPPVAAPEEDNGNGSNEVGENEYYIVDDIDDPIYWVTNEYMQKFMENVTYKDQDYSRTRIKDFPGGGPGEANIPPAVL